MGGDDKSASHRRRGLKSRRRSTSRSSFVLSARYWRRAPGVNIDNGIYCGWARAHPAIYCGRHSAVDAKMSAGGYAGPGARRPVSRVLSWAAAHAMAIHLGRPSPDASRDRPGRQVRKPTRRRFCNRRHAPLLGLAPGGVCRATPVAGRAVRSYRTLSPLLAGLAAVGERSALCGTFPGVAPAGRYPAPCFRGARTFLRRAPWGGDGGHPAVWQRLTTPPRRPGQARARPAGPAASALTRSSTAAVPASIAPSMRAGRKCR